MLVIHTILIGMGMITAIILVIALIVVVCFALERLTDALSDRKWWSYPIILAIFLTFCYILGWAITAGKH